PVRPGGRRPVSAGGARGAVALLPRPGLVAGGPADDRAARGGRRAGVTWTGGDPMTADAELNGLLARCAETHDHTPPLLRPDWLEERGDFRGEFVRAAVAFDRTPPHDITRFQLGERLRALLDAPAFKKWLPRSPAFKWGWRRGLLRLLADTRQLQAGCPTKVA